MHLLVINLCFLGFFIVTFFARFFGRLISLYLSVFCIFLLFTVALFVFYEICITNTIVTMKFSRWFFFDIMSVQLGFLFDDLNSIMLFVISCISFFVNLYSLGYLNQDPYLLRFSSYLSLFTFFMILLVISDNFVQLFVGWEGVGLCSYLLISFWFTRIEAIKAALKAMIMNRISDVFFIFGIALIILFFKTVDLVLVFLLWFIFLIDFSFLYNFFSINFICFCIFIGCVGKSAQFGLHTWLPDAMEGPTPVSSLLHAATMVTAGIFLLLRCSSILEFSNFVLFFVVIIGAITTIFSSIVGIFQYDIKKIIAFSTCSQLGYMFFSCGLSNYYIAIFHLFNHAFFKALLFLSAGSVIHALFDEQDMRKMGSIINFLPFTYLSIFIGSFAIMGFPFLTGFYSKDFLLELTFCRIFIDSGFAYLLGCAAAFFTSIYSIRLLLFVFFNDFLFYPISFIIESSFHMSISIFFLMLASIFVGYFFFDLFIGWGSFVFNDSFFQKFYVFVYIDSHFLYFLLKNIPIFFSIIGIFIGIMLVEVLSVFRWVYYVKGSYIYFFDYFPIFERLFKLILRYLNVYFYYAGFFNVLYNFLFNFLFLCFYNFFNKIVDKGFLEFFGPYGVYFSFRYVSLFFKVYPSSIIFFSIGFMFFFVMLFILYISFVYFVSFFFFLIRAFLVFYFLLL